MFDRIIALSVRNSVFVNLLFAVVCIAGLYSATQLPREQFPEVSLDRVLVVTPYAGATARDTEELIVRPIEDALDEVDDVKKVESVAREGSASVVITFLSGKDLQDARSEVEKAVSTIQDLPEDAETPQVSELKLELPVMAVALVGDRNVRREADWVSDRISKISGVASAEAYGETERRIVVELDPDKMRTLQLKPALVAAAIQGARANVPAGTVSGEGDEIFVKTDERLQSAADVAAIPLSLGSKLKLSDVATVRDVEEEPDTRYFIDGEAGVQILIQRAKDADPIGIRDQVIEILPELLEGMPPGVELRVSEDYTAVIRDRLRTVAINGASGALLVLMVLWFVSGRRQALLALWGMPVSYLTATFLMDKTNLSINVVSTFGLLIATGIIVDDAIVVIENTQRHLEMGKTRVRAAIEGAREVLLPVTVAVGTTMFAFMPLTLIGGTMGRIMKILPLTVIFCLLGSLIEAIFILPGHLSHFAGTDAKGGRTERLVRRMQAFYAPILDFCLRNRKKVSALTLVAFAGTVGLASQMDVTIAAMGKPFEYHIYYEMPAGSDRSVTEARGRELMDWVEDHVPEGHVSTTKMRVGSYMDVATQRNFTGSNLGHIRWEFHVDQEMQDRYPAFAKEVAAELNDDPRLMSWKMQEPQAGPPAGPVLTARVRGRDPEQLNGVVARLKSYLRTVEGTSDISDDRGSGKETYRVAVDADRASLYGLSENDIGLAVRAAIDGLMAAEVSIDEEKVEILVRTRGGEALDRSGIGDLTIATPAGKVVRLDQVASLERTRELGTIRRRDGLREISVTADSTMAPLDIAEVVQEYWDKEVAAEYPDMTLEFGGESEELLESLRDLPGAFLLAIALIYVTLALQFRSYVQPIIIICAVPFGLMGAVLGLFGMGYALSLFALFGIVALTGIVVNDSLVMVDFINKRLRAGAKPLEAAREGALARLRPIVTTTLTTCFGLGPLAIGLGGQDEILAPMAVAIAAGLGISTGLVLVVVPSIYCIVVGDLGFSGTNIAEDALVEVELTKVETERRTADDARLHELAAGARAERPEGAHEPTGPDE